jgi:hypothetical protein
VKNLVAYDELARELEARVVQLRTAEKAEGRAAAEDGKRP